MAQPGPRCPQLPAAGRPLRRVRTDGRTLPGPSQGRCLTAAVASGPRSAPGPSLSLPRTIVDTPTHTVGDDGADVAHGPNETDGR